MVARRRSSADPSRYRATARDRLASAIPTSWRGILGEAVADPSFSTLAGFLEGERARVTVYPASELVFNAFVLTPPDSIRAVVLGQDPYHQPGQAQGLAFSVPNGVVAPPSLRNILRELPVTPIGHSLEPWARRGVLLLNAVLTVEQGRAGSHRRKGWEPFTDAVIQAVAASPRPIVFLLWGRDARAKRHLIEGGRHIVIEAGHPSPFSYSRYFRGHAGFVAANDDLVSQGQPPIDWSL